ncbi:MAG: LptF/LptG family permease [Desulfobulbaceae bacterium]|nr:LptF/LptG family permease [Desulfobulbaceae bacterium]
MPLLLYTYLITETLAPFFASLLIFTGILFLGRLVQIFDLIVNFGISFPDFIRLCAYIAPNLFLFAIPMASMLGVILCFTRMSSANELIALKAGGTGLYRLLPPIIFIALCTALLTGYTATTLIPKSTVAMKKLFFQLAKEKIDKGLQAKQFSEELSKGVVLYIDQKEQESRKWKGVYVSDARDPENPLTIMASSGKLDADIDKMQLTVQLDNGSIHLAKRTMTQTIFFDSYILNVPVRPPEYIDGERATYIGKRGMTQQEIRDYLDSHPPSSSGSIARLIEYHSRIALPGGCFILTILALPLALRNRPGQPAIGVPIGLLLFICYYVLMTIARNMSEGGTLPIGLVQWVPNFVFALLTLYLLRIANRESGNKFLEFIMDSIFKLKKYLPLKRGGNKS